MALAGALFLPAALAYLVMQARLPAPGVAIISNVAGTWQRDEPHVLALFVDVMRRLFVVLDERPAFEPDLPPIGSRAAGYGGGYCTQPPVRDRCHYQ